MSSSSKPPRGPGSTDVPAANRPAGASGAVSEDATGVGLSGSSGKKESSSSSKKKDRRKKVSRSTTARERRNFHIHRLYVRQEYRECLKVISKQIRDYGERSEYALYTKALIKRQLGEITASLELFQKCQSLNPGSVDVLKQVARSLYLLGKYRAAIEVYEQAHRTGSEDWEVWHSKGVCFSHLREYEMAIECLKKANKLGRHDVTFAQLGKVYAARGDLAAAADVYQEALDFSPESPELLTTLGLLYLRMHKNYQAFEYLGNSLTIEGSDPRTILGAGSIISDHGDYDVALVKYRVAAVHMPNSPQLWNNIAMCFYGKGNYLAAIAALKKALYLAPFEWLICFNLGLAHLQTEQYASAYHFLSATINLKADYGAAYMYLGVALTRMGDAKNARQAYDRALALNKDDHLVPLNLAISLANAGEKVEARKHYDRFKVLFKALDDEARDADPAVKKMSSKLSSILRE